MPIEEIDRAGSFASHMSRCVHLLMELLRALRDHAFLLKLSVFLKRDPEKKDKSVFIIIKCVIVFKLRLLRLSNDRLISRKYLRDNERADLSKQALVLCLAVMRECVNETRTADHVIELYKTVKEGIKELPLKESSFKTLLSDAYRKIKGLSRVGDSDTNLLLGWFKLDASINIKFISRIRTTSSLIMRLQLIFALRN